MFIAESISLDKGSLCITGAVRSYTGTAVAKAPDRPEIIFVLEVDLGDGDLPIVVGFTKEMLSRLSLELCVLFNVKPGHMHAFPELIKKLTIGLLETVERDGRTVFSKYTNVIAEMHEFIRMRVSNVTPQQE